MKRLLSIILGLTFLLSGVIKGIDPMGMIYKLEEYFSAFGLSSLDALILPVAIILCATETALGLLLLLNRWKRTTAITTALFIAIFTSITYILYTNPYIGISDCGCFGDAIHLSNAQTFWKNIVLTLLAILHLTITFRNKNQIPKTHNSIIILLVTLFSISIPIYSYIFLPPFDFLDFNTGSNLEENSEFALFDENQNDVTNQLIYQNSKQTYLIGVRDQLEENNIEIIEPLIEKSKTGEINLILITPNPQNPLKKYDIPELYIDDIALKSLLRKDKGLILIENKTVKAKWQIEFNTNYYNSYSGRLKIWIWSIFYLIFLTAIVILNLKSDYEKNEAPQQKPKTKLWEIIYTILKTIFYVWSIIFLLVAAYFLNWIYVSDSFIIPSSSMEPTLIPGDKIQINKLIIGARVYEELDFGKGVEMKSYRAWGLRNLEHNDVVIFNCPQNRERTKLEFEINYVYGKRCIGLPGDSVSAVNGYFKNNNFSGVLGIKQQQDILSQTPDSLIPKNVINAMPFDKENFGWTIKNFGPVYVPKAGDEIQLDSLNVKLYKKVIEFEEGEELTVDDQGVIKVGNEVISKYRFKRNYYYMCGDNVSDSNDSRYWGFVPEEFIIGVVSKVLYSKDRVTGEYRWDRFSKNVL